MNTTPRTKLRDVYRNCKTPGERQPWLEITSFLKITLSKLYPFIFPWTPPRTAPLLTLHLVDFFLGWSYKMGSNICLYKIWFQICTIISIVFMQHSYSLLMYSAVRCVCVFRVWFKLNLKVTGTHAIRRKDYCHAVASLQDFVNIFFFLYMIINMYTTWRGLG